METKLHQALSDLTDNFLEMYSPGEICPSCGGEFSDNPDTVLWCEHDETCALDAAIYLNYQYLESKKNKEA